MSACKDCGEEIRWTTRHFSADGHAGTRRVAVGAEPVVNGDVEVYVRIDPRWGRMTLASRKVGAIERMGRDDLFRAHHETCGALLKDKSYRELRREMPRVRHSRSAA